MTKEEAGIILRRNGISIVEETVMKNGLGNVIKTSEGCIINIYNTGKITFQGKKNPDLEKLFQVELNPISNKKVFVVYGHDMNARTQLEAMLRRWDLEPLIIDQIASSGKTIIEKLEECTNQVNFGIVLATPDDIGYAKDKEDEKKYRVRQNVVLELGMLLSKLGREKVAILLSQSETMERPSDIDGLIYIPFTSNVEETKVSLAKELGKNGYPLEIGRL